MRHHFFDELMTSNIRFRFAYTGESFVPGDIADRCDELQAFSQNHPHLSRKIHDAARRGRRQFDHWPLCFLRSRLCRSPSPAGA
jgi:hypothetical protein